MPDSPTPFGAICYDLPTVSGFCRSVALAVVLQKTTGAEWVTYRGSSVLNAVYSVLFWKEPPGTMEIRMASRERVEEETNELHERYLTSWIGRVHSQGPAVGKAYLEDLSKTRDYAREALASLFRDVRDVNQMVANETRDAINNLATIKLISTVTVAGLGATGAIVLTGAGAVISSVVATGYSASCALIKSWNQGDSAKAVGIELGKGGASEVLGRAAAHGQSSALAAAERQWQILSSAEGQIRKYSLWFERTDLRAANIRKAQNIVTASTAQAGAARRAIDSAGRSARWAGAAKVGVPLLFAAWDIIEGIQDYRDTVQ